MSSRRSAAARSCAAILVLAGLVMAGCGRGESAEPEATRVGQQMGTAPAPTASATPTATPAPTAVPTRELTATPTPLPASEPSPQLTPTNAPAPDVRDYFQLLEGAQPAAAASAPGELAPITASSAGRVEKLFFIESGADLEWRLSPGSEYAAAVQPWWAGGGVDIYSLQSGALVARLSGTTHFALSSDGEALAFTSRNMTAVVSLRTGAPIFVLTQVRQSDVVLSPEGTRLAVEDWSGNSPFTMLWDVETGAALATIDGRSPLAFTAEDRLLTWSMAADDQAYVGTAEGWNIAQDGAEPLLSLTGPDGAPLDLYPSRDGSLLALWAGDTITVWDLQAGAVRSVLSDAGEPNYVRSAGYFGGDRAAVAFSPDGALLASLNEEALRLWDLGTAAVRWEFPGSESSSAYVQFSPDGTLLLQSASVLPGSDRTESVRVWDVLAGSIRWAVTVPEGRFATEPAAAFSPDGALLAIASDTIRRSDSQSLIMEGIQVWDAASGQLLKDLEMSLTPFGADVLLLNPQGTALIAAPDEEGRLHAFGLLSGATPRAGVRFAGASFWRFSAAVPESWVAVEPAPARYELRFEDRSIDLLTCLYSGSNNINKIIHRAEVVEVWITDLQTQERIAGRTFSGSTAATCIPTHEFGLQGGIVLTETNEADAQEFAAWLREVLPASP